MKGISQTGRVSGMGTMMLGGLVCGCVVCLGGLVA